MNEIFSPTKFISSVIHRDYKMDEYGHFVIDKQRKDYKSHNWKGKEHFIITPEIKKEIEDKISTRDLTALTTTSGLVGLAKPNVNILVQWMEFISPVPVFKQIGIPIIKVGDQNAYIPTEDTEILADVVAEGSEGTPTEPTYDVGHEITPTMYRASLKVSKKFFFHFNRKIESIPIVDYLFILRLENAIYRKLDKMLLYGSGVAPEPIGLKNNVNIQGIDGSSFSRDKSVQMENLIELYNTTGPRFYLMHPNTKKTLKQRPKSSVSDKYLIESNMLNDYPVISSTQIEATDIFHGGFSTVLIEQFGPGIEIFFNPFIDESSVYITAWGFFCHTARNPKTISLATAVD